MTDFVLANYAGNKALTDLLDGNRWLALHNGPGPTALGPDGPHNEIAGAGYIRQLIKFAVSSGKTRVSNNAQKFSGLAADTMTWLSVWDLVADGNMIFARKLIPAITVVESGFFLAAPGDVALSL